MSGSSGSAENVSTEIRAFRGATWLAIFKLVSQLFSWISTIFVARMLIPADYGLMEMSTFITGYAMLFSELGLGAAIIQRPKLNQKELSSVFWATVVISSFFALSCLIIAYPTSWIFHEPRVIPITQTVSVIFLLTGLQIVPLNLLRKELHFKKTGMIDTIGILVSCVFMIITAYLGWGVWTLISGTIVKNFVSLIIVFKIQSWRPTFSFAVKDALSYLNYGYQIAFGNSIGYVNKKSDSFFAGRLWMPNTLGVYSFAKQLSRIPNDKIVSLINQVAFPTFSLLNSNPERFNRFYLYIVKVICCLVFPLFIGGFLLGDELIKVLFDKKWYSMIYVFKIMCLTEIVTPLSSVDNMVHGAQGRPNWFVRFNIIMLIFMPLSFYLSAPYGLNAMVVPWFTSYMVICIVWNKLTLKKIGISSFQYLKNLKSPFFAVCLMGAMIIGVEQIVKYFDYRTVISSSIFLGGKIILGGGVYVLYFVLFDKDILTNIKKLRKK